MKLMYDSCQAPFGIIHLIMDDIGVKRLILTPERWEEFYVERPGLQRDRERCRQAVEQLEQYFQGKRREFEVPLSIEGTEFMKRVWRELRLIPYGQTRSYAGVAQNVGGLQYCRAVGQANRRNPLPIFIPCHRVIGKDGSLTGYIGKGHLPIKELLLEMEKNNL